MVPRTPHRNRPGAQAALQYEQRRRFLLGAKRALVGRPALPLYLGQVATRSEIPTLKLGTSAAQSMSQRGYIAREDITALKIAVANWYVDNADGLEKGQGSTLSVDASIRYPSSPNTWQPILFSASATGAAADGTLLISDWITLSTPIPAGTVFHIRLWKRWASAGILYMASSSASFPMRNTNNGLADNLTSGVTTPNCTDGTAFSNVDANIQDGCQAIVAMTRKASILIYGTSRNVGVNDAVDASGNRGEVARSIGGSLAYINVARHADRLVWWKDNFAKRRELAAFCSHAVGDGPTNDFFNSRTFAQAKGDAAIFLPNLRSGLLGGKGGQIIHCTTAVRTNTGNTATVTGESERLLWNSDLRATNLDGLVDGCFDVDSFFDANGDGLWDNNAWHNDGVHETQAGNVALQAAGTINPALLVR